MTINFDYRKVTANKQTLNYISMLAYHAANDWERNGRFALANDARKFSDAIYQLLKEANFYTEV